MRVYFWALDSVPLIYLSPFMPILSCLDYCNFVVSSEVWEGCASSFVLYSQDCFGNSRSTVVPHKSEDYLFQFCENCHGSFHRNYICRLLWGVQHFTNINSSNPRVWDIFPILCIIFKNIHQCFKISKYKSFTSVIKFIPEYFILFSAILKVIVFLLSFSDSSLCIEKQ